MVQDRLVWEVAPAEVWVEDKARAEDEWADHLPPGRAEIVSARNVATKFLML